MVLLHSQIMKLDDACMVICEALESNKSSGTCHTGVFR